MQKLIVGNWKMQKLFSDLEPYFHPFKNQIFSKNIKLGLAVPSIYIQECKKLAKDTPFIIGSQNVSEHSNGAFTGEISAQMLKSIGASFCIVGHSERRKYFHESSDLVFLKAKKLQEAGIMPIICIGETLDQRENFKEVIGAQLNKITYLEPNFLKIAYEPVWAIGTGVSASIEAVNEAHEFIRRFLKEHARDFSQTSILYGGSVTEKNGCSLLEQSEVGGLLIGGASLEAEAFKRLINTLG